MKDCFSQLTGSLGEALFPLICTDRMGGYVAFQRSNWPEDWSQPSPVVEARSSEMSLRGSRVTVNI